MRLVRSVPMQNARDMLMAECQLSVFRKIQVAIAHPNQAKRPY